MYKLFKLNYDQGLHNVSKSLNLLTPTQTELGKNVPKFQLAVFMLGIVVIFHESKEAEDLNQGVIWYDKD